MSATFQRNRATARTSGGVLMSTVKHLRAPLIVMFALIMASVAFAGPANALPYANPATTSVNNQTPAAGSKVIFCGQGFHPGTVTIVLDAGSHSTQYPSATANAAGEFCTSIILGASLTGNHTLTATTQDRTSSTTISVRGPSSGGALVAGASASAGTSAQSGVPVTVAGVSATGATGGLAFTGANAIGIGALGGLLLVGGATMVLAGRRRKVNA
jgi:hypothetical protein